MKINKMSRLAATKKTSITIFRPLSFPLDCHLDSYAVKVTYILLFHIAVTYFDGKVIVIVKHYVLEVSNGKCNSSLFFFW